MFYGCSSLIDLSGISTIITDKIIDISYMFFGCISLKYLPDINKWNLKNVKNKEGILANINEKTREKYYNKLKKFMNNEMKLIYQLNEKNKDNYINLFGKSFVKNNKNNCILIINNKLYNLMDKYYFNIQDNNINDILIIKLIEKNKITDMSYMFYECASLLSIVNFSKRKPNNVNNTSYMFYGCSSLNDLSDISTLITDKVIDISYMFFGCISLKILPDINKWNLKNVKNKENILANINEKTREKYYNKLRKFMNNEMELIYQLNKNNNDGYINLFGKSFVKNNKNNCILINSLIQLS
jgi:surface protein